MVVAAASAPELAGPLTAIGRGQARLRSIVIRHSVACFGIAESLVLATSSLSFTLVPAKEDGRPCGKIAPLFTRLHRDKNARHGVKNARIREFRALPWQALPVQTSTH